MIMNEEYEFSKDFMQDIVNIVDFCIANKTDSTTIEFDINGKTLVIDMNFSIK